MIGWMFRKLLKCSKDILVRDHSDPPPLFPPHAEAHAPGPHLLPQLPAAAPARVQAPQGLAIVQKRLQRDADLLGSDSRGGHGAREASVSKQRLVPGGRGG